jgi:hypothetical protein
LRTLIVGPHAAAAVIHDDDLNSDCRPGGGASCPPPSGLSRSPNATRLCGCRQPRLMAVARGCLGRGRMRGGRGRSTPVVFICQVLIQSGVDNWGKRSGVTLVGLGGRQCQAGEGGGGGAAPRGQLRQQRQLQRKGGERGRWTWREKGGEVCLVVLVIVISIIHSNNTYFIPIPILRASCNFWYL